MVHETDVKQDTDYLPFHFSLVNLQSVVVRRSFRVESADLKVVKSLHHAACETIFLFLVIHDACSLRWPS
jgi:hypothetical protein